VGAASLARTGETGGINGMPIGHGSAENPGHERRSASTHGALCVDEVVALGVSRELSYVPLTGISS
jgi:hypothetical protein